MLVSPELADVLSAIVSRIRKPDGAIPLIASYDIRERLWNPPMPLLFQRSIGTENRAYTPTAVRKLLIRALAATNLTTVDDNGIVFSPHDFRRVFVTDAILNGLPPHIAQVICGHKTINTTMGYKAVYPAEVIEAHRAFIGPPGPVKSTERRPMRSGTPSSPTSRNGSCRSAPAPAPTPRLVFMSMHVSGVAPAPKPHPAQPIGGDPRQPPGPHRRSHPRRMAGEVEGLQVSLAGANDKLHQIDSALQRQATVTQLGLPTFTRIAGRASLEPSERPTN